MASNGVVQLSVPQFYGINQAQERVGMGYATWAENIDTRYGRLQTAAGFTAYTPDLGEAIVTMARFHRRFYSVVSERDVLVAATDSKVSGLSFQVTSSVTSFSKSVISVA